MMKIPLATLPVESFDAQLVAPCGCDNLHFESVEVRQADDLAKITNGRVEWMRVGPNPGRGSTVAVNLWCEDGHRSQLSFTFHKGSITARVSPCEEQEWPRDGLWRD